MLCPFNLFNMFRIRMSIREILSRALKRRSDIRDDDDDDGKVYKPVLSD